MFPLLFLIILPTPLMIWGRSKPVFYLHALKTIRLFFSRAYPNTQNKLNELCIYRNFFVNYFQPNDHYGMISGFYQQLISKINCYKVTYKPRALYCATFGVLVSHLQELHSDSHLHTVIRSISSLASQGDTIIEFNPRRGAQP